MEKSIPFKTQEITAKCRCFKYSEYCEIIAVSLWSRMPSVGFQFLSLSYLDKELPNQEDSRQIFFFFLPLCTGWLLKNYLREVTLKLH